MWAFFVWQTMRACRMEQMRSASLSMYECLAVLAALILQLASLVGMLRGFGGH